MVDLNNIKFKKRRRRRKKLPTFYSLCPAHYMGKLADPRGEAKRQCTLFAETGARSAPFGTGDLANGAVPPKENEPSNINVSEQKFCRLKLFWMLLSYLAIVMKIRGIA